MWLKMIIIDIGHWKKFWDKIAKCRRENVENLWILLFNPHGEKYVYYEGVFA